MWAMLDFLICQEPQTECKGGTVEPPQPICPFICPSHAMLLTGFRPNFRELCVSLSHSSNFKTMNGPLGSGTTFL